MKTPSDTALPTYVVVQNITTIWTKRERTSTQKRLRAQIPHALPLPERAPLPPGHVGLRGDIYYHSAHYTPQNSYQSPREQWKIASSRFPAPTPVNLPNNGVIHAQVTCRPVINGIEVEFDWAGTALRMWLVNRREQYILGFGQWLQVQINARVNTWEDPYHEMHILNIGYTDGLQHKMFVNSAPSYEIREEQQIF